MFKSEEPTRVRVQIDFAPGAFNDLVRLQERIAAPSRGETVKYALWVLQWLAAEVDANGTLTIENSGERKQVVFPFLQNSEASELRRTTASASVPSGNKQRKTTAVPASRRTSVPAAKPSGVPA